MFIKNFLQTVITIIYKSIWKAFVSCHIDLIFVFFMSGHSVIQHKCIHYVTNTHVQQNDVYSAIGHSVCLTRLVSRIYYKCSQKIDIYVIYSLMTVVYSMCSLLTYILCTFMCFFFSGYIYYNMSNKNYHTIYH